MARNIEIGRVYKDSKGNLVVIRGKGYTSRYGNGFFAENEKGDIVFVANDNSFNKKTKKTKLNFVADLNPVEQNEWDKIVRSKKYQSLRDDLIWKDSNK